MAEWHLVQMPQSTGRVAVLRDYPLRLWAEQQQYTDDLLREFNLLLMGERSGELQSQAPGRLVALADMFTTRFGPLIDAIRTERQAALDAGLDRMDSEIPLLENLPDLLEQVRVVLDSADEFCRSGQLLTLPRRPHLVALATWTHTELIAQYGGAEPSPWPGPF